MEYQELRTIYIGNLEKLAEHCETIEKMIEVNLKHLHQHMVSLGIYSRCFLDGWLLSLMSKVVPLQSMAPIITTFKK